MMNQWMPALLLAGASLQCFAQENFPNRLLRLVVPYTAGGTGDQIGRLVGDKMGEILGQRVLIGNKPGAGGNLGAEATVRSPADGYTLVMAATSLASNPALQKKLSFDPVKDLVAVSQGCGVPMVVVTPTLLVKNIRELVAYAKANPGKLNFSSSGIGTSSHLAGELFKSLADVDMTHIPYKADSQALPDLLAGNVQLMFMFQTSALPQVKAGKLRALAVSTASRGPAAPELPTVAEAGVQGYDFNGWFGLFAPSGTSKAVVDKLNAAAVKAVQSPDLKAKLIEAGFVPTPPDTPAQFATFLQGEVAKWARVAREAKLQAAD
jgi:tripartite-type tricarboxylate transporter receptor subunit TctC